MSDINHFMPYKVLGLQRSGSKRSDCCNFKMELERYQSK